MKRLIVAVALLGAAALPVLSAKAPTVKGTYAEARTAEVFTGGCVMNAEAGTVGREALMAWRVDQGRFNGVDLAGLSVVAAVAADANLGIHEIGGENATARAAVFVDERATPAQRQALLAMAKSHSNGIVDTVVEVTPVAITFVDNAAAISVTAAPVNLVVSKELSHDPTCGSKQWFGPLATVDAAEMGTAAQNAYRGATLGLKWSDPNKRSAFFGTFSY